MEMGEDGPREGAGDAAFGVVVVLEEGRGMLDDLFLSLAMAGSCLGVGAGGVKL